MEYINNLTTLARRLRPFLWSQFRQFIDSQDSGGLHNAIYLFDLGTSDAHEFPGTFAGIDQANNLASAGDIIWINCHQIAGDIVLKAGIEYVGLGRGHTILTGNVRGANAARLENLSILRSVNSADDHSGLHMSVEGGVMDVVNCDIVCNNAGAGAGWGTLVDDGEVRFIESRTEGSTDGLHIEAIVIESGTPAGPATLTQHALSQGGVFVVAFGALVEQYSMAKSSGGPNPHSHVIYKLDSTGLGYGGGRLRATVYVEADSGRYNHGQRTASGVSGSYTPDYWTDASPFDSINFQAGDTLIMNAGSDGTFPNGVGYFAFMFGEHFVAGSGSFKILKLEWRRASDAAILELWTPGTVDAYTGVPIATLRRTTITGTTLDINNVDGTCSVSDCDFDFTKTSGTITYLRGDRISRGANEFPAFTAKATPVAGDLVVIEDSAAGYAKKKAQLDSLSSAHTHDLPDPLAFKTAASILTIVTGAVTVTQSVHAIAAETGTADDLATVSGGVARALLMIQADTGDTITVKHGTGNIFLNGAADFEISGDKTRLLVYDGTDWSDEGAGGGGVAAHNIISAEHTDTNTAIAPSEGDLLVRRSSLWEAEAGVDIGSDASGISKINADEQGSDPAAPGAGNRILYPKADGWYERDSAGVVSPVGGGDVASDEIWDAKGDLAAGTGADAAARLAVGSNSQMIIADSAQSTGLRWRDTPSSEALMTGSGVSLEPITNEEEDDWLYGD